MAFCKERRWGPPNIEVVRSSFCLRAVDSIRELLSAAKEGGIIVRVLRVFWLHIPNGRVVLLLFGGKVKNPYCCDDISA